MAVNEAITRYGLIIKKLRKRSSTFEQIKEYLAFESNFQGVDFAISKRTFHRDLNNIRLAYNIDIRYNLKSKLYYIAANDDEGISGRMIEAFDLFNTLKVTERYTEYIHFENRQLSGTENMVFLLEAIHNNEVVRFEYQSFWNTSSSTRVVAPYALKEFSNRWYLIAEETDGSKIKTFALDRLKNPELLGETFDYPEGFDIKEYFKYSFGIIDSNDEEPELVYLSFTAHQGKYIKSLPLHHSQTIIKDTAHELVVRLHLCLTFDFIKELLSFGVTMKVLAPENLSVALKENYTRSLNRYPDNQQDLLVSLNEILEVDRLDENHVKSLLSRALSHDYYFNLVDLTIYDSNERCRLTENKLKAIQKNNFELAAHYRGLEKDYQDKFLIPDDFLVNRSQFVLIGTQLYYFFAGTAGNDPEVKKCFEEVQESDPMHVKTKT